MMSIKTIKRGELHFLIDSSDPDAIQVTCYLGDPNDKDIDSCLMFSFHINYAKDVIAGLSAVIQHNDLDKVINRLPKER